MNCPELAVATTSADGTPRVTIKGSVDSWHVRSIEDVIDNYLSDDARSMTIDISQASFSDAESLSIMIRALRRGCTEMKISVIADDRVSSILRIADFGPNVLISAIKAEESTGQPEYYTSRWMSRSVGDEEMPLAA